MRTTWFLVTTAFLVLTSADGQLLQGPMNALLVDRKNGSPRYLYCQTTDNHPASQFNWYFTPSSSDTPVQIVTGCQSTWNNATYQTDSSTANSCHLIILSISQAVDGFFNCSVAGLSASSEIRVIEFALTPVSSVANTSSVALTCTYSYFPSNHSYFQQPDIFWQSNNRCQQQAPFYNTTVSGSSQSGNIIVSSTATVTCGDSDQFPDFVCFAAMDAITSDAPFVFASNDPYTSLAYFTVHGIDIVFDPSVVLITPNTPELSNGETCLDSILTCRTAAYPLAVSYHWILPNGTLTPGNQSDLTLNQSGMGIQYICLAYTMYGIFNSSVSVNVADCESSASFPVLSTTPPTVNSDFLIFPINTIVAIHDDSQTILYCQSATRNYRSISWYFTPLSTGQRVLIVQKCVTIYDEYDHYHIYAYRDNVNSCHLLLGPITQDVAGLYTCDIDGVKRSAEVVVVESYLNYSSEVKDFGETIEFYCSFTYPTSRYVQTAVIGWKSNSSCSLSVFGETDSTNNPSLTTVLSQLRADCWPSGQSPEFACIAAFNQVNEFAPVNFALNKPFTTLGNVLGPNQIFDPSQIRITVNFVGNLDNHNCAPISELACQVSFYPSQVQYQWQSNLGSLLLADQGGLISISESGTYTCFVLSDFGIFNQSITIDINQPYCPTTNGTSNGTQGCAAYCNDCTLNGSPFCDPNSCMPSYTYNNDTQICLPCVSECQSCIPGLVLDQANSQCQDVDECLIGTQNCTESQTCINTVDLTLVSVNTDEEQ